MNSSSQPATGTPVSLRIRLRPWMAVTVLTATLAGALVGYGLARRLAPSHVASVDLLVLPNERGVVDEALVRTFESVLRADAFAAEVTERGTEPTVQALTSSQVAASISTSRSPTSSLIEVRVTRPDPESALAIAEIIGPTVDELLTAGGTEAGAFYRQVFPEPLVRERAALSTSIAAAIGAFLGFVLGVAGVILWSVRRPVVSTVEELQELAGYPVIARLPDRTSWWRGRRLNRLDPLAAVVEQVRDTGLIERGGVVAVVSPETDLSVTFSTELASVLAETCARSVYLVDANFRSADLTRRLGGQDRNGWDRLEPERCSVDSVEAQFQPLVPDASAHEDQVRPLFVPVARHGPEHDRVIVDQFVRVLDRLRTEGVAVVSCPPVPGDVPAAPAIIGASVVLMVARPGVTSPDEMSLVGEMVAALSDAPAGVVVVGERPSV